MNPADFLSELLSLGQLEPDEFMYWLSGHAHLFRRADGSPVNDAYSFGLFFRDVGQLAEFQRVSLAFDPRKTQLLGPLPQRQWKGEDA